MDAVINDSEVVYAYTRQDAIDDGVVLDLTEYISSLGVNLDRKFDRIYFTTSLFEDIGLLNAGDAISVISDIVDLAEKSETQSFDRAKHFYLPYSPVKIRSLKEVDNYILEVCYESED